MPRPPVLVDARAAVRTEVGGVERWARELVRRLPALFPGRYRVARPRPALAHRAGHAWEQVALPARAAVTGAQLIVCPANLGPVASRRNVLVLHDLSVIRHPEWFSAAYVRWHHAVLPRLARRAAAVITVSGFSRDEIRELLAVSEEQLAIVAGGVDARRFSPRVDPEPVRDRLGLARPYVLAVGTDSPRKNLAALDELARRLRELDFELVLAGGNRRYLEPTPPAGGIRRVGYVPEGDLPALYAGAGAFVLPSRYEGFGLPCLEAMASGVPVVASAATALPETCGAAAELVEPDDRAGFAAAVLRILEDPEVRRERVDAGLRRAAGLTWDAAARGTDAVVQRVLET